MCARALCARTRHACMECRFSCPPPPPRVPPKAPLTRVTRMRIRGGLVYKLSPSSVGPSSRAAAEGVGEKGGRRDGWARVAHLKRERPGCPRKPLYALPGPVGGRGGGSPRAGSAREFRESWRNSIGNEGGGKSSGRRPDASVGPRIPGRLDAGIGFGARRVPCPA